MLALKQPHEEPDAQTAAAKGLPEGEAAATAAVSEAGATDNAAREQRNHTAIDMLRRMPGVTAGNYRIILQYVNSLAELASLSESQLAQIITPANAKRLYTFLHRGSGESKTA